jgi:hypothetical protein
MAGGKPGFVLGSRPRRYPTTASQKRIGEAARFCGIRKGMTRLELIEAMKTCVPAYFEKKREENRQSPPSPVFKE